MKGYWLVLGILAVWRITHLLQAEEGPGKLLRRWREGLAPGFAGTLVGCFYCLSVWVAAPAAVWLGETWKERLLLWPALSGAAILLERFSARKIMESGPAPYVEDPEVEHGMLRTIHDEEKSDAVSGGDPRP